MLLHRPTPAQQESLFDRDIQLGADGSLVRDGDVVLILHPTRRLCFMDQIDFFHGMIFDQPIALTMSDDDIAATEMVGIRRTGFVVRRFAHVQSRWRLRRSVRADRYSVRMVLVGILIARLWHRSQIAPASGCHVTPRNGERWWMQYQDTDGTRWWYYNGPLGKWWCWNEGDDPQEYHE